ncbi:hypothetical protein [Streptomyces sp. CB01881]|uniref:hypothetical protein n=1 Tax=Streptomyces sp. CB01881 TaxID=2078691 RepID=UPI001F120FCC|nr:hypothetical protein [Streptomyces sp. CB01881]
MVCASQTGAYVPLRSTAGISVSGPRCAPPENSRSSGISAIWIGTTWSAKTTKNTVSLPRNRTQASPYAAIAASTSGKSVAGMLIASEFTRNGIRPVETPEPPSNSTVW